MAKTLSSLRSRVNVKLNNLGDSAKLKFQESEVDDMINQAILHVGYVGEIALIQRNLSKVSTLSVSGGLITKPTDFFRHRYARVDSRRARFASPEEIDDFLYDEQKIAGNKNKYIVDYDGTRFQVYPTSASSVEFHYIAVLTELTTDSSTSPLTDLGDTYAADWAYGLALEAKGFNPRLGAQVMARVNSILRKVPLSGQAADDGGNGGGGTGGGAGGHTGQGGEA